ncbi:hypothetical protein [Runella salmonicolor]|uniref:DUF2029 domain-containing protein n=1 Tax=Runella salmonicolor TaxID=2950278 RepID=A0ABT1FPD6_9BACT|nr:hypothetical protein [Runella salmonicolor]MCP1383631.1 hypothetical protein [Runella salmonicolor]
MPKAPKSASILWFLLFILVSAAGYGLVGYHWKRTQAGELILTFGVLFLMYALVISQKWDKIQTQKWIWGALGFRVLLLFSMPALSDDYFRFIWDGRLLSVSYNPYLYLPSEIITTSVAADAHLNAALFQGLNSPNYFTVYPPLNQWMFGLSAWMAGDSVLLNIVALRSFILMAELGTIYLLTTFRFPKYKEKGIQNAVLIYALNPFVIIELTGNLHFEAVTLFCVLLAVRWIDRPFRGDKYNVGSAGALAMGAAVKLLPLIFLPLIFKRFGFRKGLVYCVIVGLILVTLFAPFLSRELVVNFGKSLDLYFQKFEFNASFYYLFRKVGYWITGYNIIHLLGPLLSLVTLGCIAQIAFQRRSLPEKMLLVLTVYFLCATTVHPWYITTLVALGALTGRWYPVVWSALLPLTYVAYASQPYEENLRIVALEYILVIGCLVYELFVKGIDWNAPTKDV